MSRVLTFTVGILFCVLPCFAAPEPTINYQGRLTAAGSDYTGFGYFKFRLLGDGGAGVWANDGSAGTGQPGSHATVEVNNGLFTVSLGATNVTGTMRAIHPLVFHESTLNLRTWFSTNAAGAFEKLVPDVPIARLNYATFDTGEMIVVAKDGRGDFDNIQDAINCVASNQGDVVNGIGIMPGTYTLSAPLAFPTNTEVYLRGLGADLMDVRIVSAGMAIRVDAHTRARLWNLTAIGAPAVSDAGGSGALECHECALVRPVGSVGPVAVLENGTELGAVHGGVYNESGGPALVLTGDSRFRARECSIEVGNGATNVITISGNAEVELEDLHVELSGAGHAILVSEQGGASLVNCAVENEGQHAAICLVNAQGEIRAAGCEIDGISGNGGKPRLRCTDCRIAGLGFLDVGDGGSLDMTDCHVVPHPNGVDGMVFKRCYAQVYLRDCDIHSESGTAVHVEDTPRVHVEGGELKARDGTALRVLASASYDDEEGGVSASLEHARVCNEGSGDHDCIVIEKSPGNTYDVTCVAALDWCTVMGDIRDGVCCLRGEIQVEKSEISAERHGVWGEDAEVSVLLGSEISAGVGDGINCTGGEVEVGWSEVDGGRDGINCTDGEVDIERSEVEGERAGVWAVNSDVEVELGSDVEGEEYGVYLNGGELYATFSEIEAGDDDEDGQPGHGIHAVGNVEIEVLSCTVEGDAPDSNPTGIGIYADLSGDEIQCDIRNSLVIGKGRGIRMSGVDDLDIQCSRVEGDTSDGIWISSGGLNFIAGEVYGGDVAIRSVNGAELDLNASVVDGKNSAVDSDGDTTILDCEIDTNADGGSALILRNSAESAYVERSRLRLDNDTTANNVVTLYGVGWNTAPRPPAFHASILKSVSANPHYAIGLSGGATTANVFMMNCGLSSGLAPGISKLAPDSTDTYGNYVIPAAAR